MGLALFKKRVVLLVDLLGHRRTERRSNCVLEEEGEVLKTDSLNKTSFSLRYNTIF